MQMSKANISKILQISRNTLDRKIEGSSPWNVKEIILWSQYRGLTFEQAARDLMQITKKHINLYGKGEKEDEDSK